MPDEPPASRWAKRPARWAGAGLAVLLGWALLVISRRGSEVSQAVVAPQAADLRERPASGPGYAGDAACRACHPDKVESYHRTAHAMTSRWPSAESILGSFLPGANELRTSNPGLTFRMETGAGGFFQTAVERISPGEIRERRERIDLVIGSGRKGQTYLYWRQDLLFELPVTYWSDHAEWMNSPGYIDGTADFERAVGPRCLECHAAYFEIQHPPFNRYLKSSVVPGISCERCHGPGREHVARFQSAKLLAVAPHETTLVNPARLERGRQLDICAACHGGLGQNLTPPLSFQPGDVLSRHLHQPKPAPDAPVDVHGNQVELLKRSACFQGTTMTCSTCHDTHQIQRDTAAFALHCLNCHQVERCGKYQALGAAITSRCVDCHMPLQQTNQIVLSGDGQTVRPRVRNHRIAIYPGTDFVPTNTP